MSVNKRSFTIWVLATFRPSHTIPAACHVTTLPAPPRHPLSQLPTLHTCPALPRMPCPFPSILQTPPSYGLSSNQLLLPSQGSPAGCLPRLSHTPTTGLPHSRARHSARSLPFGQSFLQQLATPPGSGQEQTPWQQGPGSESLLGTGCVALVWLPHGWVLQCPHL